MWVNLYTHKVASTPAFNTLPFPTDYPEGSAPQVARAISLGEATAVIEGAKLSKASMAHWFKLFYRGFGTQVSWFPFLEFDDFEIPFLFRVENPVSDEASTDILNVLISPYVLPRASAR